MDAKRRNRVLQDSDHSDSEDDHRPKKKTLANELLDKLNFDNIPDDVQFGFTPIGMPPNPFEGKFNDDSNSDDNEDEDSDVNQFRISSYNDIYKQVEKDLKGKVKINGSGAESTTTASTSEKVSFPIAPGQNLASLDELKQDLETARASKNHKSIVSLCSSCAKKAPTKEEKIKFLAEKYRSLEALNLPKLCEETINEILIVDPQNVDFKFYQTKYLIKNSKNIWKSQVEYLRARSLIEEKLSKYPEDYDLNKYLGELEQIYYSIKVKVQQEKPTSKSYMQIGGNNTNGTCGNGSDESTKDHYIALDELYAKKISSVATGDFHTLIVCEILKQDKETDGVNTNVGDTDIIAFGLNQHGQVDAIPSQDSVLYPKVVPFFIGKKPKLVSACRSRSVALTEDGKVYEWGFVGSEKKQFNILHDFSQDSSDKNKEEVDEIIDIKCGLEFTLFLSKNGKAYIIGAISQIGEYVFESQDLLPLNDLCGKSSIMDFTPSFAKDFMESRLKERGELKEKKQIKITKLDAGYSHAILLDSEGIVYVLGAGHYGQLGMGFDTIRTSKPAILEELNDGLDRIINVA